VTTTSSSPDATVRPWRDASVGSLPRANFESRRAREIENHRAWMPYRCRLPPGTVHRPRRRRPPIGGHTKRRPFGRHVESLREDQHARFSTRHLRRATEELVRHAGEESRAARSAGDRLIRGPVRWCQESAPSRVRRSPANHDVDDRVGIFRQQRGCSRAVATDVAIRAELRSTGIMMPAMWYCRERDDSSSSTQTHGTGVFDNRATRR